MELPNSVRIGPFEYWVSRAPRIFSAEGKELWGEIDHSAREIRLSDRTLNGGWPAIISLMHEVAHGIQVNAGEQTETEEEEKVIVRLTTGLGAFLRDNPAVVEYIHFNSRLSSVPPKEVKK